MLTSGSSITDLKSTHQSDALLLPSDIGEEGTNDGNGGEDVLLAAATPTPLTPVVVPGLPVPASAIVAPGPGSTTVVVPGSGSTTVVAPGPASTTVVVPGPGSTTIVVVPGWPVSASTAGVAPGSTARYSREAQTTARAEIDETQ